jgi:hypothetical protein
MGCKIKIFGFLFLAMSLMTFKSLSGQFAPPNLDYFQSPVDHKIVLAGSFGELRSTHFHAGLDIKPATSNSIDSIRCSAEGRVSRIKIQSGGYGRAIYIDHPNGYTTVYAHLQLFTDTLEEFISNIQKEAESYNVDIYPEEHDFIFQQGKVIGLMGNTGRSFAKHLHFEIRETKTEIPVNPAIWGLKPDDNIHPDILSIDVQGLTPEYLMTSKITFYTSNEGKGDFRIPYNVVKVPAWRCGIAVQAFDRMNGASNRNGVYKHKMYVDDTLYYSYKMDAVSFDETRYINSHVDYATRQKENRTTIRCYKLPGNRLSIYDSIRNDGVIKLYKSKARKVKIEISDIEGNESSISFLLLRDESMTAKSAPSFNIILDHQKADTIALNEMIAIIPANALDKSQFIDYAVTSDDQSQYEYSIGDNSLILFRNGRIYLPLPNFGGLEDKAVVAYAEKGEWSSLGGKIIGEKISGYWRNGGKFKVLLDTIAPIINVLPRKNTFTYGQNIQVDIWDEFGNELDIRVELDGKWYLSPYKEMTRRLNIPIDKNIKPGDHQLSITAKDDRGNKTDYKKTITIF